VKGVVLVNPQSRKWGARKKGFRWSLEYASLLLYKSCMLVSLAYPCGMGCDFLFLDFKIKDVCLWSTETQPDTEELHTPNHVCRDDDAVLPHGPEQQLF